MSFILPFFAMTKKMTSLNEINVFHCLLTFHKPIFLGSLFCDENINLLQPYLISDPRLSSSAFSKIISKETSHLDPYLEAS